MCPRETMDEFDERFSNIYIELITLGKTYPNREVIINVMKALPREWDIKTMAMRESKNLNTLELHDLFADLKAYEFEMKMRNEETSSTSTHALVSTESIQLSSAAKTADLISNEAMALFTKKFGKYMRKNQSNSNTPIFKGKNDSKCFNCDKPGHYAANY